MSPTRVTSFALLLLAVGGCHGGTSTTKTKTASTAAVTTASTTPVTSTATPSLPAAPTSATRPALKAPVVASNAKGTTITWEEAQRGAQGYVLELDDDGDATNGVWTKDVATGTTTTNAPDLFTPSAGQGPILLVAGSSYTVRVVYTATKEKSPVAPFLKPAAAVIAGAVPPDDLDLGQATVLNSPADVATWARTAKITKLDLSPTGVHIEFTKRDGQGSWPDVPAFGPGPGHDLEYTLWIVINVKGKWHTSGCIQYWRGCDKNGGPPDEYAKNWYYDAIRWGAMTGHQPAVGEQVGFFVAAGNERNVSVLPDPTQVLV